MMRFLHRHLLPSLNRFNSAEGVCQLLSRGNLSPIEGMERDFPRHVRNCLPIASRVHGGAHMGTKDTQVLR